MASSVNVNTTRMQVKLPDGIKIISGDYWLDVVAKSECQEDSLALISNLLDALEKEYQTVETNRS